MPHQKQFWGRFKAISLILIGLLIGGLVAPLTLAAPAAQTSTVLRIGYLGVPGSDAADGAQLAIDQINGAGGFTAADGTICTFKLVVLSNPAPTVETFANDLAELVGKNVVAILGPDTNDLITTETFQALMNTGLPVLLGATSDSLTDLDTADTIFRIRAPEHVYSVALANYLTTDLSLASIALIQADVQSTEGMIIFQGELEKAGITPAAVLLPGAGSLADQATQIISLNPQAVVMWGTPQDVTTILTQLRAGGWAGQFVYRDAEEAVRSGALPAQLADGVIGINSWSYGYTSRASRIFLREYVTTFGKVPGTLSAAAYDAIWYLRSAAIKQGSTPGAIQAGLLNGDAITLIQGAIHPQDFVNGDLTRTVTIYKLGAHGGPVVVARYDDTQRLPLEEAGPEVVQAGPTLSPGSPTITPVPSATLEGTWARVTANTLNVRSGPGANYDVLGKLGFNDMVRIIGTVADYSWLMVDFQGTPGWVKTGYTEITGNLALVSIVQPPASPTPAFTPTPTLPAGPEIVIDSVVLNPAQLTPYQPFTATVTVRNAGGGAAGRFAVAATFEPGDVYTATFVEGLAGGQSTQVQLNAAVTGTGFFQIGVVADLNKEVAEIDETNNVYNISYRSDYPIFVEQAGLQLSPGMALDLYGGTVDLVWDGNNLNAEYGSLLGVLGGVTYENVHYDALSPSVVNNPGYIPSEQINAGVVIGIYTAEGRRGVIRIDNRQGSTIWITYRVYNNTP